MVKRYLLDTNAIVVILKTKSHPLLAILEQADWVGVSVISVVEFLAFSAISEHDRVLFEQFSERINIVELESANTQLIQSVTSLRKTYRLKLPDAIIAASALLNDSVLITADKGFSGIKVLHVKSPEAF